MPPLTVDTTTGTVLVAFEDDKGNPVGPPTNLGPITFTSSDETVATVVSDLVNPLQGNITPVGVGTVDLGVAPFVDGTGAPLILTDGVTPFPVPPTASVSIDPAPAAQAVLTVTE